MTNSVLHAWLRQRGYWVYTSGTAPRSDSPLTHVFLDGGRARVPPQELDAFGAVYSRAVAAGACVHAVERLPPPPAVFRMFMDVDGGLDLGELLEALPSGLRRGSVLVCTKRADDGKPGTHLVWEDVWVQANEALALCDAVRRQLSPPASPGPPRSARRVTRVERTSVERTSVERTSVERTSVRTETSIIDTSVYRSGGLRMPWSYKGASSTPRVPSYYEPTQVADAATGDVWSVAVDRTDADAVQVWLRRLSLLTSPATVVVAPLLPHVHDPRHEAGQGDGGDGGDGGADDREGEGHAVVRRALMRCGRAGEPFLTPICVFERVAWVAGHTQIRVRTNSHACLIGRPPGAPPRQHRSNRVTLLVTATDVFQYCFCRCEGSPCAVPGARAHLGRHRHGGVEAALGANATVRPARGAGASVTPACAAVSVSLTIMKHCAQERERRRAKSKTSGPPPEHDT